MIVFKVVGKNLESAMASHVVKSNVQYEIEKKVHPKFEGAYLYAFSTLRAAKAFVKEYDRDMRRSLSQKLETVDEVPHVSVALSDKRLRAFWRSFDGWIEYAPKHTVWCEWIELIEEVRSPQEVI